MQGSPPILEPSDQNASILEAFRDGSWFVDSESRIVKVNQALCEMTGFPADELLDAGPPFPFEAEEELGRLAAGFETAHARRHGRFELLLKRKDGERFPAIVTLAPVGGSGDPGTGGTLAIAHDVRATGRDIGSRLAERQPVPERDQGANLLAWEWDPAEDRIRVSSPRLLAMAGLPPARADLSLDQALAGVAPPSHRERVIAAIRRLAAADYEEVCLEHRVTVPNPALEWVEVRAQVVRGGGGRIEGVRGTVEDVTDRRRAERRLPGGHERLHALTEIMGQGMFTLDAEGRVTYLNPAGEQLLGWSEDELRGQTIHEVTHGRLDEGSPSSTASRPMMEVLETGKPVRVFDDIFIRKDGSEVPVGYTSAPIPEESGIQGLVVVFSDISERKARERQLEQEKAALSWLGRLRDALANDRLTVFAQPIVELATGTAVRYELLIRMLDDDSIIQPGEFLPAAEANGLICEIDRWMIARAAEIAAADHAVSVNLSARSVSDSRTIKAFLEALERTAADPARIMVELTETAIFGDEKAAVLLLKRLCRLGCHLALDDFGTGYGGFTYLKRLPIDVLKIDIEFVRDLLTNRTSAQVVQTVVELARGLGMQTIAEGVEEEATLAELGELGVDFAQGYAIARPMPAAEAIGAIAT